jgi:hypothetical protein
MTTARTLYERMNDLALAVYERDETLAREIAELAQEMDENYVLVDVEGDVPTNAQGIALARVIRSRWAGDIDYNVTVGREMSFGANKTQRIGFQFVDGYTGGIAPDGSVNT